MWPCSHLPRCPFPRFPWGGPSVCRSNTMGQILCWGTGVSVSSPHNLIHAPVMLVAPTLAEGIFNTFSTFYPLLCLLQAGVAPKERWDRKQRRLSVAPLNMMCFNSVISSEIGTKFCFLLHKANLHLSFGSVKGRGEGNVTQPHSAFP